MLMGMVGDKKPSVVSGTITLIASALQGTGASSATTTPAVDTTGANCIIVSVAVNQGNAGSLVITDNKSNGNATFLDFANPGGPVAALYYWLSPTVGSGHTFTASATSMFGRIAAYAFSGVHASPFDTHGTASSSSGTSATSGSFTPSQNNCAIVAVCACGSGLNFTDCTAVASPLTLTTHGNYISNTTTGIGEAYEIQTTATARNVTFTLDTSDMWAVVAYAIKAA